MKIFIRDKLADIFIKFTKNVATTTKDDGPVLDIADFKMYTIKETFTT